MSTDIWRIFLNNTVARTALFFFKLCKNKVEKLKCDPGNSTV